MKFPGSSVTNGTQCCTSADLGEYSKIVLADLMRNLPAYHFFQNVDVTTGYCCYNFQDGYKYTHA